MVFFFIFDTSLFAFCGCNFLMKWLHRYPYDQLQNGWLMFQLDNHHHWHAILSFDVLLTHQNHINLAVSHGPPNPEFQTSLSRQLNHFKLKAGVCVVSSSLFKSLQRCLFAVSLVWPTALASIWVWLKWHSLNECT